ncbi:MAG: hypothetical protein ACT4PW_08800 [Acidimicrobiia bacterium]
MRTREPAARVTRIMVGVAVFAGSAIFAAVSTDRGWWDDRVDVVSDLAFLIILSGPVICVASLLSGLLHRRAAVRAALTLLAGVWTAWVAAFLADGFAVREGDLTPRAVYLILGGAAVALLACGWRAEDALAHRRRHRADERLER